MIPTVPIVPATAKASPHFFRSRRFLLLLILVLLTGLGLYVLLPRVLKTSPFGPKAPRVELQTQYENPFDQNTQYVNPFDENKNPLRNL